MAGSRRILSRKRTGYEDLEEVARSLTQVRSRGGFFSPITADVEVEGTGSADDWNVATNAALTPRMWQAVTNNSTIRELIRTSPEEVVTVLRDHSCKKLGTFRMKDSEVLLSFGNSTMLTRGSHTVREGDYEDKWRAVLNELKESNGGGGQILDGAWEEEVTVAAYVVNIRDAAAEQKDGLLSYLVRKSQHGAASNEIFTFAAVRAVIEYKWRHWARKWLLREFALYLGWLASFCFFLIIYIEGDLASGFNSEGLGTNVLQTLAFIADPAAVIFMVPFVLIEIKTFYRYRLGWFSVWNVLDTVAYVLQIMVTYGHLTKDFLGSQQMYSTILALQCVFLFVKAQYFSRVLGSGPSFVELLGQVMARVRWFLFFIVVTMISVAMAFAVLYKADADDVGTSLQSATVEFSNTTEDSGGTNPEESAAVGIVELNAEEDETEEDFGNTVRSLVTTYAVLLGDFDSSYVFEGSNRVVKGIFFLFFQLMMSITVLNLLIAVMTESYTSIMGEFGSMYNMGRADVMDELEVALPPWWGPHLKPFCHFIIVEKKPKLTGALSSEVSDPSKLSKAYGEELLRKEVEELKSTVMEMKDILVQLSKDRGFGGNSAAAEK